MRIRLTVTLVAILSHASACGGSDRPAIGIATNRDFEHAAVLALEDAERELGALPADTVFVTESLTRAATAIRTASALADMGRVVAVVGHSNSASSLAAAPIYNDAEIVQLSPQSSAAAYSDAGPFSFRLVPPDDRQGRFLAEQLRAMEGVERIVLLYVNDDYGRGLRASLIQALGGRAPQVVGEAPHLEGPVGAEDLALARRVVEEGAPDVIVWLGRPLILSRYLRVLRSAAPEAQFIGSDAVAVAPRQPMLSSLWQGVRFVDFADLSGSAAMIDFRQRFRARFGRPATAADALTYDATRLLMQAVHEGAETAPELRDWLNSLGRERPAYDGLTGPITFEPDGDVQRTYVLGVVDPASAR